MVKVVIGMDANNATGSKAKAPLLKAVSDQPQGQVKAKAVFPQGQAKAVSGPGQ